MQTEKATLGCGCFWSPEEVYRHMDGIINTAVGYAGGDMENPTYEDVCYRNTGHAEVVQVEFDPEKLSYAKLLQMFWELHDPTQFNRQGPDVGSQYRSVIFYHDDEQKKIAEQSKQALIDSGKYEKEVLTQIEPLDQFYRAEEYHQKFIAKRKGMV